VSRAVISWIGGPVLRARMTGPFTVYEAVWVGPRRLLGEVIQLKGDELVAQVYEDTTGLEPGVTVEGSGRTLSVPLGPGLLGGIFDGLLRPLTGGEDFQVKAGLGAGTVGRFPFTPQATPGSEIEAGAVLGSIAAARAQSILVPPGLHGRLDWLAAEGEYAEDAPIARLVAANGTQHEIAMRHPWPVRTPRPVRARLPASGPMITGQRILDTLFPVARGSRAALPGGFGTGKTVLQEALA
jgi:V/A-type H+-transporting ATPase subunit A